MGDYVNRYDRAVRHVDDQLASLFAALAADGVLDDTLVIVTSDHGESLGERDFFGHGCYFWEELVRVPLLLRLPGRVPAGWKTIVPGYSDEVAHRLGLIDTDLSVAQARARYRINDLARRFIDDSMFSLRIRATEP